MFYMAAGVSTGCFSSLRAEAKFFICLYDKLCLLGFVSIFESAVFGFLPKCALNGAIFVTVFGMSLLLGI